MKGSTVFMFFAGAIVFIIFSVFFIFIDELKLVHSVKKINAEGNLFSIEFSNDYHLDEIMECGISSDLELENVLIKYMSHGFYKKGSVSKNHIGCSVLSCKTKDGNLIWGRNFDWYDSVPIIVYSKPQKGYSSISTCEFTNVSGKKKVFPESFASKFLAIASYYVPMDGINEKGLCIAELEVNEGGQIFLDTEKKNVTVTMAMRYILNRAATVDEAIAILEKYDICPVGGISSHLSISDASGRSVAVEFINGRIEVVETSVLTNFNIYNGDLSAGGESAMERYNSLKFDYEKHNGVMNEHEMTVSMKNAAQLSGEWKTRWTIIYENKKEAGEKNNHITMYLDADFKKPYKFYLK